jgi:hypothetical protein
VFDRSRSATDDTASALRLNWMGMLLAPTSVRSSGAGTAEECKCTGIVRVVPERSRCVSLTSPARPVKSCLVFMGTVAFEAEVL